MHERSAQSLGTFLNAAELSETFGISRASLFNLRKRGQFPQGIKLGKSRRWNLAEVQQWLTDHADISRTEDDIHAR